MDFKVEILKHPTDEDWLLCKKMHIGHGWERQRKAPDGRMEAQNTRGGTQSDKNVTIRIQNNKYSVLGKRPFMSARSRDTVC